ncbi:MAG TPA: DUF6351 family protein, partial [Marmoricola sp.]|nr:DUF6351 family protein [Marmoricola sp.]
DRDQYRISTLWQPGKRWTPFAPQPTFNHKLLISHGASCGADHTTGSAPSTNGNTADSAQTALGRGFIVMSNALDNSGHNCNVALQAESLEMTKEHVIKSYGTLKFTIGEGCSGGSLAAQQVANAYPGIYQGITVTCSFPDAWSTASQFIDYHLLLAYFGNSAKWGSGVLWTPVQEAAVEGNLLPLNALVSEAAQWHVAVPTDACAGTTTTTRYNARTNPRGVRCDIQDAAVNLFGRNPKSKWSRAERAAGYGFALPPIDNEGVQYGLSALKQGLITPAMFVDLNKKIGGVNIDTNPTASRITMGVPALANAYRSGAIDEANNLGQTAIIDCRGPDPGLFHDAYRAFAVRARLDRAYGSHANQLIWEGPVPILGDTNCMVNAFTAMDRWLDAVVADKSAASLVHKIAVDKPGDLSDRCYAGVGIKFTDALCGQLIVPLNGTPRTVAGDAITTDANKCHLKPFNAASYGSGFSTSDLGTLKRIFATGVCDFRKPGVDQQGTVPWQTYQTATGAVIYGGRKMPAVPRSVFAAS